MELITNARQWHRLWSIRFAILSAVFGALATAYAALPADWLPAIPSWAKLAMAGGTLTSSVAAAVARVVQQSSLATTITPTVPPPESK
ncbi:hypothetical protein SAMN04487785_1134 [Dyella jiangningensis]|uniref:DUF7940 domain-containing protein n=1 Tax=Dyella sp. AtDHG13 TaxID=1938897 RepID=UPI000882EE09|nr:hypothetical protein [Dyella sp. AtDHG13]PXV60902.1 hypothetical protein BDW41_102633 [Dyella sp. AtDHG13]SDK93819.1 hypothetical protein SAMN04487785_1134 [Dyella jiangningensis]